MFSDGVEPTNREPIVRDKEHRLGPQAKSVVTKRLHTKGSSTQDRSENCLTLLPASGFLRGIHLPERCPEVFSILIS